MVHWKISVSRGCLPHDSLTGIAEPDLLPRPGVAELPLAGAGVPAVVAVVGWIVAGGAVGPEILTLILGINGTLGLSLIVIVSFRY